LNYIPLKQGTLLIPSGPPEDCDRKHLFIILTDKDKTGRHAIVSVSSVKDGKYYDKTTILQPGCHSFITRESYVFYQMADIVRSEKLIKGVESWSYTPKKPVSTQIFEKICRGLPQSDDTPQRIITYFLRNT